MSTRITFKSPQRAVCWVVWGVWAVMLIAALGYAWNFGSNVPYWDEWNMVGALTKNQPITLQWLWAVHNGHRIPFPRLILLGLYKISGADFRVGMYFDVVGLAAAAAILIWASERLRGGRASVADAFFPLLLLHWSHYENFLWSWQVTQILPIILLCGLLAVIATCGFALRTGAAIFALLAVVTLPLSGVPGLAYAPAAAAWLGLAGLVSFRNGRRRLAIVMWAATVVTLIFVGLYFYHYRSNTSIVLFEQPRAVVKTAVRFEAGALGLIAAKLWPVSGATAAAITLASVGMLLWRSVQRGLSLDSAKGLLLFSIGSLSLVAAFALGRTNVAFISRYFALAVPLWCAAFLAWPASTKPAVARSVQTFLAVMLLFAVPLNVPDGLRYARDYHRRMEAFRLDLLAGASPEELVANHVADLCPCPWSGFSDAGLHQEWGDLPWDTGFPATNTVSFHEKIALALHQLHAAKIGDYGRMRTELPPITELTPSPDRGFAITRPDEVSGKGDRADTAVICTPDRPIYLIGLRIWRPAGSADVLPNEVLGHGDSKRRWVQVLWRLQNETAYMAPNRYVFLWDPGKNEEIVWVFQMVDQIAFHVGDREVQRQLGPGSLPFVLLVPSQSGTPTSAFLH